MPFIEIELITPAYAAAAAQALADRQCPDCQEPVSVVPGTFPRAEGKPGEILECFPCDTEWFPRQGPGPVPPGMPPSWCRTRRNASLVAEGLAARRG